MQAVAEKKQHSISSIIDKLVEAKIDKLLRSCCICGDKYIEAAMFSTNAKGEQKHVCIECLYSLK